MTTKRWVSPSTLAARASSSDLPLKYLKLKASAMPALPAASIGAKSRVSMGVATPGDQEARKNIAAAAAAAAAASAADGYVVYQTPTDARYSRSKR